MTISFDPTSPIHPQATLYFWQDRALSGTVFGDDPWLSGYVSVEVRDLRFEIVSPYSKDFRRVQLEFRLLAAQSRLKSKHMGAQRLLVIAQGYDLPSFPNWVEVTANRSRLRFPNASEEWPAEIDRFITGLRDDGVNILADFRSANLSQYEREEVTAVFKSIAPPIRLDVAPAAEVMVVSPALLEEGAITQITVNRYERNQEARRRCLEFYGTTCQVCKVDLGKTYPGIGDGYIEVHHLKPLGSIQQNYQVDPVTDLLPVCPNCHAMLHSRRPDPYTPGELIAILKAKAEQKEDPPYEDPF